MDDKSTESRLTISTKINRYNVTITRLVKETEIMEVE